MLFFGWNGGLILENNIISFENVSYNYEEVDELGFKKVLNNIDLQVKQGEFLVVLGHNGSGKSTLAKHINALVLPSEGNVVVDGLNTKDHDSLWKIRNTAGMVFQNPDNQLVATIVEEDVAFGPENLGIESSEIRKRVDESLSQVGMLEYKRHAPHLLSGGQKQRIAIAGILAMKPKCIIFDEPTAMLDPSGRKDVMRAINDLNKNHGITIILITHYMDEAVQGDRVVVIDNGTIKLEGKPRDVFSQVELMNEIGLDVPQVTQLSYELMKCGINIDTNILNVDEMVNALCQLK